jgi:hypothetical protein
MLLAVLEFIYIYIYTYIVIYILHNRMFITPPYPPDFFVFDFLLFPRIKLLLRGRHFQNVPNIW